MGGLCINTNFPHEVLKMASVRGFSVPGMVHPLQNKLSSARTGKREGAHHHAWATRGVTVGRGGVVHSAASHGIKL